MKVLSDESSILSTSTIFMKKFLSENYGKLLFAFLMGIYGWSTTPARPWGGFILDALLAYGFAYNLLKPRTEPEEICPYCSSPQTVVGKRRAWIHHDHCKFADVNPYDENECREILSE